MIEFLLGKYGVLQPNLTSIILYTDLNYSLAGQTSCVKSLVNFHQALRYTGSSGAEVYVARPEHASKFGEGIMSVLKLMD